MRCQAAFAMLVAVGVAACADNPVSQQQGEDNSVLPSAPAAADFNAFSSEGRSGQREIAVLDDCDPNDPAWAPTGGCTLKGGNTTNAEFFALLGSPLSLSVVGHPAWRNEPSYVKAETGKTVRVRNDGGRGHTFTRVANFGGGRVPPLNQGLTIAPECVLAPGATDPTEILPGERLRVSGLASGIHRFQCCIHPWMRALVRVTPEHDH